MFWVMHRRCPNSHYRNTDLESIHCGSQRIGVSGVVTHDEWGNPPVVHSKKPPHESMKAGVSCFLFRASNDD